MILSDKKIRQEVEQGNITISDFDTKRLNPNSYDVLLSDEIGMYLPTCYDTEVLVETLDKLREQDFNLFYDFIHSIQSKILVNPFDNRTIKIYKFKIPEKGFVIKPQHFYLYSIKETVGSKLYASEIKNKSSLARLSLLIHFVASWIDVGFEGNITLEMTSFVEILLRPDMKIGQLVFHESTEVETSYDKKEGSKYMNQKGVQESKYYKNYEL